MQYRWDHVHLKAADVEATVKWYVEVLGAEATGPRLFRGSSEVDLDLGGARVVVHGELCDELALPESLHPRMGVDHIGLTVDDLEQAVDELGQQGVEVLEQPWVVSPGVRMACIAAPDKVRVELWEYAS